MLEIRADSHYGVEPVKGQGAAAVTLTFLPVQTDLLRLRRCAHHRVVCEATAGAGCSFMLTGVAYDTACCSQGWRGR